MNSRALPKNIDLGLVVEMVSDIVISFDFRRTQLRDAVWERRHILDYPGVLAEHRAAADAIQSCSISAVCQSCGVMQSSEI